MFKIYYIIWGDVDTDKYLYFAAVPRVDETVLVKERAYTVKAINWLVEEGVYTPFMELKGSV